MKQLCFASGVRPGQPRSLRATIPYDQALATLLEIPLVWQSDVQALVLELRDAGELDVVGMQPRERTPKPGHVLQRKP